MRQAGRWRVGALALGALLVGALALGAVLIVAYLDRMEPTGAAWHFPVVSSRSPVLPDPPAAFVRVDPLTDAPTFMSGSPDRLVLSKGYGRSGIGTKGSDSAAVPVVAFDFARWRWMSLPNARYDSLALPDVWPVWGSAAVRRRMATRGVRSRSRPCVGVIGTGATSR